MPPQGGCCAAWSGDDSPYGPMGNYFCGNSSAGGWVGYMDPRMDNHSQGGCIFEYIFKIWTAMTLFVRILLTV